MSVGLMVRRQYVMLHGLLSPPPEPHVLSIRDNDLHRAARWNEVPSFATELERPPRFCTVQVHVRRLQPSQRYVPLAPCNVPLVV